MSFKIIGIGEVLWDVFPTGKRLGGAPANFAYHAHALGADAKLISRVGNDASGREILQRLEMLGLPTAGIALDPAHETGSVTVKLDDAGQPHYTIHEGVAWDHLHADAADLSAMASADAVCFGSLAQRSAESRKAIRAMVTTAPRAALRIFDVNLRQSFYSAELLGDSLKLSNVLKLNDAELPVMAHLLGLKATEDRAQLAELAERHALRLVIYTRGAQGSLLYDGRRWSEHSGIAVNVVDTVGAGDSLTAAVTLGFLMGWDLDTINDRANGIAAYVCSREGATPELPQNLREHFRSGAASADVTGT